MTYLLNVAYLIYLAALSPWLVYKSLTTGKYRRGLWSKICGIAPQLEQDAPCAWFHGVSVGEVHLLRPVIRGFRERHPDWVCVLSTSTDTGFEEAKKRFPDLSVFYWPLDFTWAVRSALRAVNPALVVLAEGELWPNFLSAAEQRGVAVALINGRMSPRSLRSYSRIGPLARRLVASLDLLLVQSDDYASAYRELGALPARVHVTGSVKYDGVECDRHNPKTRALGALLDVRAQDLVWIAGSTQHPEEEYALRLFRQARARHPNLRLILVPRQKERFDEVAEMLRRTKEPFVRRSELVRPVADRRGIVLVDTIGELGALWGLADVAFVGGSLDGRRGGQNMIEPAAYGAAVVFGPHVWNFRDTARLLVAAGAAVQVADAAGFDTAIGRLLADEAERERLGSAARRFVRQQQGATELTLNHLDALLAGSRAQGRAA